MNHKKTYFDVKGKNIYQDSDSMFLSLDINSYYPSDMNLKEFNRINSLTEKIILKNEMIYALQYLLLIKITNDNTFQLVIDKFQLEKFIIRSKINSNYNQASMTSEQIDHLYSELLFIDEMLSYINKKAMKK